MDKREELESKLSYTTIEKMFNKNPNSRLIKHLIVMREDKTLLNDNEHDVDIEGGSSVEVETDVRIINVTVEDIRNELITTILQREDDIKAGRLNKNGEQYEPIKRIYGFAKHFVNARIVDIIMDDLPARTSYKKILELRRAIKEIKEAQHEDEIDVYKRELLEVEITRKRLEIERIEREIAKIKDEPPKGDIPPDIEDPDKGADQAVFTSEQKQILLQFLQKLGDIQRAVIELFFYKDYTIEEIAEKLNMDLQRVRDIKCYAETKLGELLLKEYGFEIKNIRGPLHDILVRQEMDQKAPASVAGFAHEYSKLINPGEEEEVSMDTEYKKMLLHTICDVAKISPISDMIDEFLYNRLSEEQKNLCEQHLLECDDCFKKLQERKNIILAFKAIKKDMKKMQ